MKKLLWMMLAALPMQAVASVEDPIAYKCYYCTPAEMEDVALAQGVGRHYVYDAFKKTIHGFEVGTANGQLNASSFPVEHWVDKQFQGMMKLFNNSTGQIEGWVDSYLYAPDTEHGRLDRYMWGHHLSALHPRHAESQEKMHRLLVEDDTFAFLDTAASDGRLLRFSYMVEGDRPIIARVSYIGSDLGLSYFYFDHDNRRWRYLHSIERRNSTDYSLEEGRDDFVPYQGKRTITYSWGESHRARKFAQRAAWASIPVHGTYPTSGNVRFQCYRDGDDIQCHIE